MWRSNFTHDSNFKRESCSMDLDVEAVLAEGHSMLTESICADQKLWRAIARARQSGCRDRMNLALDAFIVRSESTFGSQQ